jgi:hypothetical protein
VSAAVAVALAAALASVGAAVAAFLVVRRARASTRTLEDEIERGKAAFEEVIAREVELRGAELERTLALARSESLAALADEERRIAEERRRDVAEREREASAKLAEALTVAQGRVEERLVQWGADLNKLQEGLATELARLTQRQQQLGTQIEGRIQSEGERLQGILEEQRGLIGKVRDDLVRSGDEVAKAAAAELEQHAAERRQALNEIADRLRRREAELKEEIDRQQAEAIQRLGAQLGDVEHRQLEQLRRVVSREATRYAEAAAQQFETTIRSAREEAARRLGRELDLAVERFAREAEGVLAERVDHVADAAAKRVEARLANLGGDLDRQSDEALRSLERRAHDVELDLRARLEGIAADAEAERMALEARVQELHRRLDDLAARRT